MFKHVKRLIIPRRMHDLPDDEREERVKPFAKRKLINLPASAFQMIQCPFLKPRRNTIIFFILET
jgi:hypothetical protein